MPCVFLSPPGRSAAQKGAVAAVHQRDGLLDQALRSSALGRGFPFRAAADGHAGIDDRSGELVRAGMVAVARKDTVEQVEQQRQTPALERRRAKSRRKARRRRAREPAIEPPNSCMAELNVQVSHQHIGKRYVVARAPHPDPMRAVDIAKDKVPAARQQAVGKDDRPPADIAGPNVRIARRRGLKDHGRRRKGRMPERGRIGRWLIGCDGETKGPIAGPSPPGPRDRRRPFGAGDRHIVDDSPGCAAGTPVRIPPCREPGLCHWSWQADLPYSLARMGGKLGRAPDAKELQKLGTYLPTNGGLRRLSEPAEARTRQSPLRRAGRDQTRS